MNKPIPEEIAPILERLIEFHESAGQKISVLSESAPAVEDSAGEFFGSLTSMAIVFSGTPAQCYFVEALVSSALL